MVNISREQVAQTGFLPDGTQLLQDTIPLKVIDRKILTESVKGKSPIMLLTGVFQRADEKNANGRVYPLDVLSEAIGDMQDAVKERRVLGEFDHPCCVLSSLKNAKVFTTEGWKSYDAVKEGDYVYSRKDGNAVPSLVSAVINENYSGPICMFYGEQNIGLTLPHKLILDDEQGKQIEVTVKEFHNNKDKYDNYKIPRINEDLKDVSGTICNSIQTEIMKVENDRIWCITTEHGNFFMENNGCSFWTGNSDAKIHMERVSHLITKLWLENKTVYGQIEVINDNRCPCGSMLSCYIDRGIQIGISSRGVGDMEVSMNEGEESYTVQPGFKFITFDAVAEPSVKGTQLKKLEESINHKKMNTMELIRMREALLQREIRRFLG